MERRSKGPEGSVQWVLRESGKIQSGGGQMDGIQPMDFRSEHSYNGMASASTSVAATGRNRWVWAARVCAQPQQADAQEMFAQTCRQAKHLPQAAAARSSPASGPLRDQRR